MFGYKANGDARRTLHLQLPNEAGTDSAGSGATEEGLTSRGGRNLRLPLRFGLRLIGKDSDAGRDWGQKEKGTTEDEMAGWHHCLDGHESQ